MRVVLIGLILFSSSLSGCLIAPLNLCEEEDCFPLSSETLNAILALPDSFNVLKLSDDYEILRIETSSVIEIQNERVSIDWSVGKDGVKNLSSIALRYNIANAAVDTEVIEGTDITNVRIGNVWYEGRDALPEYKDPFYEIARLASENPDGLWPPFAFDTTEFADLDWQITGDLLSLQQVATGTNGTHTIILELGGSPPMILGIEIYDGAGTDFSLSVDIGDSASINLQENLPRTPIQFIPGNNFVVYDSIRIWSGTIPNGVSEVEPSELEFHVRTDIQNNTASLSSMNFNDVILNITIDDGTWWEFYWMDVDLDNFVSGGDYYNIRTNSTADVTISVFDIWANTWTNDFL
jgi:hypothetical protein|tara:strand:+ start:1667 stop:2719 length:1053 start_codon:yes stop_codon:yes gene_type:complete